VIRIDRLACSVGKFKLGELSLSVGRGEYFAVLGPTGCGKTMLMECICGLRPLDRGGISVDGIEVTRKSPELRGFGYVPQDYVLFPFLTVSENILFPLRVRKKLDADVKAHFGALVDTLRIGHLLERKPRHLSAGEKQRAALARALATKPKLLLLDEPYSAVDMGLRKKLWVEMKAIHGHFQTTVLHVTHDLDEALALARRAAVLVDGQLEQVGSMGEILDRPSTKRVAEFTGMTNLSRGRVAGVDAAANRMAILWKGRTLFAPLHEGLAPTLAPGDEVEFYLRPAGIKPAAINEPAAEEASLLPARFLSTVARRDGRTLFFRIPDGTDAGDAGADQIEVSVGSECGFAPREGEIATLRISTEAVGVFVAGRIAGAGAVCP